MRTPNPLLVVACTTGLTLLVAIGVFYIGPKRICESAGGRWGSAQDTCVTRWCAKTGSCGKWAYPAERCGQLKVGDGRDEVYFQLGDPDELTSTGAKWQAGKAEEGFVIATFKAERLESLACPAR
jgi:hypothetical protein